MRLGRYLFAVVLAASTPALADKLTFDHRLNPALQAALDSGEKDLIAFNDKNPAYVTDLIVVRGTSVKSWTEAMIIISRRPDEKVPGENEWLAELKAQAQAQCPSTFAIISQDETALTVERQSTGCPSSYPRSALYRIVRGKPSLFLLGAMSRDGFSPEARQNWLRLFASARLD